MSEWISVEDSLPCSVTGCWSSVVEVKCNLGFSYNISYFSGVEDGCWQRTGEFIRNESDKIIKWRLLACED